jgi:hypothetical protein
MERTIGNLFEEVKLHSNPFMNLSERGLRQCQVNTMISMVPDLDQEKNPLPRGSVDLGDSYVFLRAMDTTARPDTALEAVAINAYLRRIEMPEQANPHVVRWVRLRLPNGQIARSAWKESLKSLTKLRMARNVKVSLLI